MKEVPLKCAKCNSIRMKVFSGCIDGFYRSFKYKCLDCDHDTRFTNVIAVSEGGKK